MPEQIPTNPGQVVLWDRAGQRFVRWPVDARAMVAQGDYTLEPPEGAEAVKGGDPVPAEPLAPLTVISGTHPSGGPLNVVRSEDAPAVAPITRPKGRRAKGA